MNKTESTLDQFKENVILESEGSFVLQTDSNGLGYVISAEGTLSKVTYHGKHVGNSSWEGLSLQAADSINGSNQVIWDYSNGDLGLATADANWDARSWRRIQSDTDQFFQIERDFKMDFNKDGIVGERNLNTSVLESEGTITLHIDSNGMGYVESADNVLDDITYYGKHVGNSSWDRLTMLAADSIDGNNLVIWKYSDGNLGVAKSDDRDPVARRFCTLRLLLVFWLIAAT